MSLPGQFTAALKIKSLCHGLITSQKTYHTFSLFYGHNQASSSCVNAPVYLAEIDADTKQCFCSRCYPWLISLKQESLTWMLNWLSLPCCINRNLEECRQLWFTDIIDRITVHYKTLYGSSYTLSTKSPTCFVRTSQGFCCNYKTTGFDIMSDQEITILALLTAWIVYLFGTTHHLFECV